MGLLITVKVTPVDVTDRDAARALIIDELHNVLAGRGDTRREFLNLNLNLVRFLGNELRIPLVGVGTHEAYLAIRSDDQLENRFEPFLCPGGNPTSRRAHS